MAGRGLERMREGVPVVEHCALPSAFELVGLHIPCLDRGAARDDFLEDERMPRDEVVRHGRDEVVLHQRVLCDLSETAAVLAIGQRREHRCGLGEVAKYALM